ncbi:TetR/AcrR family transcriptional regulator [Streptosporangium sp. CA-135522]|uniref:TetR/AcrR family transcriptional regulator n=1 Tax=Streptosporangium sp. CA-135522 TaxID=3240072 RepID=UPI003D8FAB3F
MPARTGRPPKISRADIMSAAHRIIDAEGIQGLTMRRLAREVGTTAMALYHHVRDKDDLLQLLLDEYAAGIEMPELHDEDPVERVAAAATAMRQALIGCPWIVEVLRSDDLLSVRALWYPETIIDGLVRAGLTPEEAVDGYRIIWHYTAGEISARAAVARRREKDRPTYRSRIFTDLDPVKLPRLAALGERWEELTARDTYDKGVRALVHGLLRPPADRRR